MKIYEIMLREKTRSENYLPCSGICVTYVCTWLTLGQGGEMATVGCIVQCWLSSLPCASRALRIYQNLAKATWLTSPPLCCSGWTPGTGQEQRSTYRLHAPGEGWRPLPPRLPLHCAVPAWTGVEPPPVHWAQGRGDAGLWVPGVQGHLIWKVEGGVAAATLTVLCFGAPGGRDKGNALGARHHLLEGLHMQGWAARLCCCPWGAQLRASRGAQLGSQVLHTQGVRLL